MQKLRTRRFPTVAVALSVALAVVVRGNGPPSLGVAPSWRPSEVGHPTFLSPHSNPIAASGERVFVVNTAADTLDVIDASQRKVVARVRVGVDPVSVAVRPDGTEAWVSNHVSDSVSVVDLDPESPTHLQVVATIQDIDPATGATRFDEPVGVAFAGDAKAYVALSSENQVAVVDVAAREVVDRLPISAQDPRALVVRGERLYVAPFESGNQTQLSGGRSPFDDDLVTFDAWEHSVNNNNVLSLGAVVDIVKHPRVPDRDLFVFDTRTDELVEVVDTLGTLLYGLSVDSRGRVFIAQADARNEINGRSGTKKHGLEELENRPFLNQITRVDFSDGAAGVPTFFDLEPLPPEQPRSGAALATPFAVEVSGDDSTLVACAAGSDQVFTVDAETGEVLGRVEVGAVPRGIALESDADGAPARAWVLNAVANTVSMVDLSRPARPRVRGTVKLEDPTHPVIKRGRIAFNTAKASTTETFSCASCHPDGHTDQLLWVLDTPVVSGGDQIMPRSTMPVRGLRDTAPFHWDGIPGDPYGGNNSAEVFGQVAPNSAVDEPASTTRHLIDGALASTMRLSTGPRGRRAKEAGALSEKERDDMAEFLLCVSYPPAQRRSYTNELSRRARQGFELFHIRGDDDEKPANNVCGDCHRMPFLVSTNTPGTGMDAPTWRGAYDRWLILPQGRLNIIAFDFFRSIAEDGLPERRIWQLSWGARRGFDPVWNMVLEGSTGFSGAFARQVTLGPETADHQETEDLLAALEDAAREDAVVLQAEGVFVEQGEARPVALQFDGKSGEYVDDAGQGHTRGQLVSLASTASFTATFTARHGPHADLDHPQPALWTEGAIEAQRGHQEFPVLYPGRERMVLSGRHVQRGARVILNGRRVEAELRFDDEALELRLDSLPPVGMHFLQVQNPGGLFSNDFLFHVVEDADAAEAMSERVERERGPRGGGALRDAVSSGNLRRVKGMVANGSDVNGPHPDDGSLPLGTAALHGHHEIAEFLIERGARVSGKNRDGNTPLHVAAFLCRHEVIEVLIEGGADLRAPNGRGETPADVVSAPWSPQLADFYASIGASIGRALDLERMERDRPRVLRRLTEARSRDD